MKKRLLVSFSGGETSAFMAQWLWKHKKDEYKMIFVFANTGQENEETLEFVEACSKEFGFPVVWIETKVNHGENISSGYKTVDFKTASRNGDPFEEVIKKYGIPNQAFPHCTRELKLNPIKSYARSIGWTDYYTAIGIRSDEADRINAKAKKEKLIYPLINRGMIPMTKPKINFWWNQQPFRLNLKGYQGNCKWCWKKSHKKLFRLAKETPEIFKFPDEMETKYGRFTPETRSEINPPYTFFRGNMSTKDILANSKYATREVKDDSAVTDIIEQLELFDNDLVGGESCEIFSECNG